MNSHPNIWQRPMFRFLFLLTFAVSLSYQGWTALYTNYAVEVVGVDGEQTGIIHAMREVPGLLSIGVVFCLLFVSEVRLMALAVMATGIGIILTSFFPTFWGIIGCATLMSFGFHYYEATTQSLTLQYFSKHEAPYIMGKLRSATAAGSLGIGLLVLALSTLFSYFWLFIITGSFAVVAGAWALTQHPTSADMPIQRRSMVFKKSYWLYYTLTLFSGARRHIFTTFSIFLLVKIFHFTVQEMLILFILNNSINWVLNPLIGKAIATFGERKLLSIKYIVLASIFLVYISTDNKLLVAALYVVEQIFTNFSMAIRSFFQKIADAQDISPSIAMGQTINHISAVILPVAGGILWLIDYRIPFLLGIVVALGGLIAAQCIRHYEPIMNA